MPIGEMSKRDSASNALSSAILGQAHSRVFLVVYMTKDGIVGCECLCPRRTKCYTLSFLAWCTYTISRKVSPSTCSLARCGRCWLPVIGSAGAKLYTRMPHKTWTLSLVTSLQECTVDICAYAPRMIYIVA